MNGKLRSAALPTAAVIGVWLAAGGGATQASAQARPDVVDVLPPSDVQGLEVRPAVVGAYEDNVYRVNSRRAPKIDDFILTPTLAASFQRTYGSQRVRIGGSAGYDIFAQQSNLNKPRLIANADGTLSVAGVCTVSPAGYFRRERSDFGDINSTVQNIQRFGALNVTAACDRSAGFYPSVRYERTTTRNTNIFDYADQSTDSVVAGVGYRKPSLGSLYLYYRHDHSDRPTLDLNNDIDEVGLNFIRAISSQLQADVDVQYLRVRSSNPLVRSYDGPGWRVGLSSRAVPNTLITINTGRRIVNDSLAASGYAIQSNYGATAVFAITNLTALNFAVDFRRRRFRQDPAVPQTTLTSDHSVFAQLGLTRKLSERITLRADLTRNSRRTSDGISSYNANRATIGVNARF